MRPFMRHAAAGALLAMTIALSGCGAILDRVEQGIEDAAADSGQDIDANFGGDNCLGGWVNYPDGDLIHAQGFRANDVEVCVTSLMAPAPVDVDQGLPRITNGNELAELEAMLGIFDVQAGLPLAELQQLATGDLEEGWRSWRPRASAWTPTGTGHGSCSSPRAPRTAMRCR